MSQSESDITEIFTYMTPATVGGLTSTLVSYPFDTVKWFNLLFRKHSHLIKYFRRRLQINGSRGNVFYLGIEDCVRQICTHEGVLALYGGVTIATVRFLTTTFLQTSLLAIYLKINGKVN